MKDLLLFCICFALFQTVHAQDKIFKKDKSVIECKVTEVGVNEIKYVLSEEGSEDSPVIAISVDMVEKIIFSNGREMSFSNPMNDPNSYLEDKKNALKIHFLSPLTGHLGFSYEKSLKPGRSVESEIGLIGIGFTDRSFEKSSGVYFSTGLKFMKTPDFYSQRMKYSHILKGSYVKPQVLFSIYSYEQYDVHNMQFAINEDIFAGALVVNLGKQIVYDNFFLIDYSVGLGYGFSNAKKTQNLYYETQRTYHYGFITGAEGTPVAVTARLKVGILIK